MFQVLLLAFIAIPVFATTIINKSPTSCTVTFKRGNESSPACILSQNKQITDTEAFGQGHEAAGAMISATIDFLTADRITLALDNLDTNAHVALTLPNCAGERCDATESVPMTWSTCFWNIVSYGTYYGSMVALSPTGATLFSAQGAKFGGAIGITVMQQTLSSAPPLVSIFSPLLITGGNSMGIAGGYALGAATGAIILPLSFAAGWHIANALITYARASDEKVEINVLDLFDNDWVLLEKPAAYEDLEQSFVLVEDDETANAAL